MSERKHPIGLPFLFMTELWERFGFYLILAIFTLYLKDFETGRGMSSGMASDIYGTFLGLIYLTPFVGGLLADRLMGYRRAITLGGALMGIGYMMMAVPGDMAFYAALGLIVIGNGFFKPNISTLLGNIYNDDRYIKRKDSGYNIFYMGINIGAFISPFIAAWLRNQYSWGHAFVAAGIGMFLGLIIFWMGNKHYAAADVRKKDAKGSEAWRVVGIVMLPALAIGTVVFLLSSHFGSLVGSPSTDAFLAGCIPVVIFYVLLMRRAEPHERPSLAALLTIMAVSVVFWAVFKQNGTALTYWAENFTDREMPAAIARPAQWLGMTQQVEYRQDTVVLYDPQFRPVPGPGGEPMKTVAFHPYFNNVPEAQRPQPNSQALLISTELFQSVNPLFVVILTPVVVGFFALLRRRRLEPATPAKIGWGMVITGLSALVMYAAVVASEFGTEKASALWLVASYGVITIGELFLSPMALSLVSKVSPQRYTGLLMGGWFLSTSIGIKLSGFLASMWDTYDRKDHFFLVNCAAALAAAVLIFLLLPWLRKAIGPRQA